MIEIKKIKCIIWDLDNTLWNGILLENYNVALGKGKILLDVSTEYGIVHSICSNNPEKLVQKKLVEFNIDSYFVFNSINYKAKGLRIKEQINAMNLRAENVLFIDDEISNLKEAEYYNEGIMVSPPYIIEELIKFYRNEVRKGIRNNRLQYYRKMELRTIKKQDYLSNEDFLINSNINVYIKHDCINVFERLHDLCLRTNQLNFTKKRSGVEEFKNEIITSKESGYIEVSDKYGDYGIVGYYILNECELTHFVFSCRIMNMGVEHYVYDFLKKPNIYIVGEVASKLGEYSPYWINKLDNAKILNQTLAKEKKILLKGSCDLRRMKIFLPSNIYYEVPYVNMGKNIVYQTGLPTIAMSLEYTKEEINQEIKGLPFYSLDYYDTTLFDNQYDIVVLSTISLGNLGVYINKKKNFFVSMGVPNEPMHIEENEHLYIKSGKYANGFENSKDMFYKLREFSYIFEEYPDKYLSSHLTSIIENIKAKKIVLILGNEELYKNKKTLAGLYFSKVNRIIESVANKNNCICVNLSMLIESEEDVINHFNHFTSLVYFKLASILKNIFEEEVYE